MVKNGIGGCSTISGIIYEEKLKIKDFFETRRIDNKCGEFCYYKNILKCRVFKKHELYTFLEEEGINWPERITSKILPDTVILVNNNIFIIEIKYQECAGSVDEKIQTCDFKNKKYKKLLSEFNVKYCYVLNDWFRKEKYAEVLEYIESIGCHYFFNDIPLSYFKINIEEN